MLDGSSSSEFCLDVHISNLLLVISTRSTQILISFLVSYIYLEAASGAVQMLYYRFRPNKVGSCSPPCSPPPCFLLVFLSFFGCFLVGRWGGCMERDTGPDLHTTIMCWCAQSTTAKSAALSLGGDFVHPFMTAAWWGWLHYVKVGFLPLLLWYFWDAGAIRWWTGGARGAAVQFYVGFHALSCNLKFWIWCALQCFECT